MLLGVCAVNFSSRRPFFEGGNMLFRVFAVNCSSRRPVFEGGKHAFRGVCR